MQRDAKSLTLFLLFLFCFGWAGAFENQDDIVVSSSTIDDGVEYSTIPVGSSFVRHLAIQLNEDVKLLSRMEKRGFGRAEIITLGKISQKSGTALKDLARKRLKDRPSLRSMAEAAQMNYDELYIEVQDIKKQIEAQGDQDLPPPVFDKKELDPNASQPKKKKKKSKKETVTP